MSKRLPYFQFEPAEWLAGDIMFCTLQAQGLFSTLQAIYWQKDCDLNLEQAIKRLKNKELFEELISEKIIKIKNGNIKIHFLDEQWDKLSEKSKINAKNGALGGRPKKVKITEKITENKPNGFDSVSKIQTESKALRREEKKEDKNIYAFSAEIITAESEGKNSEDEIQESEFIEIWKRARLHYDKQKCGFEKLLPFERQNFKSLITEFTKKQFEYAVGGLFFQNTLPAVRVRPNWLLQRENFEKMLDCWVNRNKIFESKDSKVQKTERFQKGDV